LTWPSYLPADDTGYGLRQYRRRAAGLALVDGTVPFRGGQDQAGWRWEIPRRPCPIRPTRSSPRAQPGSIRMSEGHGRSGSRGGTAVRPPLPGGRRKYEIFGRPATGQSRWIFLGMGQERKLDLRLDDQRPRAVHHRGPARGAQVGSGYNAFRHGKTIRMRILRSACRSRLGARNAGCDVPERYSGVGRHSAQKDTVTGTTRTSSKAWAAISVVGPLRRARAGARPESRDRIFLCHPAASAEEQALRGKRSSATLAHPRISAADCLPTICRHCSRSTAKAQRAAVFEQGVRLALQTILVSPEFIFPHGVRSAECGFPGAFTGSATSSLPRACRSFLWSSIPDDELLAVCRGAEASATRQSWAPKSGAMLADPRLAGSGEELYVGQWLFPA